MKHLLTDAETEGVSSIARYDKTSYRKVAQAQYNLLLSHFPKSEDLGHWSTEYYHGYITMIEFKELLKKEIFGDEKDA